MKAEIRKERGRGGREAQAVFVNRGCDRIKTMIVTGIWKG
jgi:hypothetical protein